MAVAIPVNDYEDALQVACAQIAALDGIVTRDKTYSSPSVTIYTPAVAVQVSGNMSE
jgi:hypothetical protein